MSEKRCRNCAFFDKGGNEFGYCNIDLPPWMTVDENDRFVHIDARCDLHKPKETEEGKV